MPCAVPIPGLFEQLWGLRSPGRGRLAHVHSGEGQRFDDGRLNINVTGNFWSFAKRRLKLYQGATRRNVQPFMRKVDFLSNQRDGRSVLEYLYRPLKTCPDQRSVPRWNGIEALYRHGPTSSRQQ